MELTGSSYLFALAAVSITFSGFSALIMTFRQTIGGGLSRLDSWVAQVFVQLGFLVTAASLTPPVLVVCHLPATHVLSGCSALMGILVAGFALTYPSRRHKVSGAPTPAFVWLDISLLLAAAVVFFLNAAGVFYPPDVGLFAVSLTATLFVAGLGYLHALGTLHGQMSSH